MKTFLLYVHGSFRLFFLLALLTVVSCQLAISVSREEASARSQTELIEGRTIYNRSCQDCHDLFQPDEYSFNEWHAAVRAYGPRAKLTREESISVLSYLIWALKEEQSLDDPIQP